jgi:Site-specific recombinase XerD
MHDANLTLFLPASNKLKSREHLPSIWDDDDIISILSCIDRGNPIGKRDYAMILLALRLGLRGSDIKGMKLCDINWEQDTITIVQQKTKESVALPLSIEVGHAIIDYLKNSQPISKQPYVFLALRAFIISDIFIFQFAFVFPVVIQWKIRFFRGIWLLNKVILPVIS